MILEVIQNLSLNIHTYGLMLLESCNENVDI
jgi:hypothetical protein